MDRRRFLAGLAATTLGGGRALAATAPRGTLPSTGFSPGTGILRTRYKVLEIFLVGAASHRDTLWVESASSTNRAPNLAVDDTSIDWTTEFGGNLDGSRYAMGNDIGGEAIHLGPCAKPLNDAGFLSRARVAAVGHDRPVHPLAQWHGLTGLPFGRSASAGMGAWVEQRTSSTKLKSWVVASRASQAPFAITPALRTSPDAPVAPVFLPIGDASYQSRLGRSQAADDVRAALRGAYANALVGSGGAVRSAGHDAYDAAAQRLAGSDQVQAALTGLTLSRSGGRTRTNNESQLAIRAARALLKGDAEYVCVLDTGAIYPFDQHLTAQVDDPTSSTYVQTVARTSLRYVTENLASTFAALVESDSHSLNLDEVLVVVHSEFGRYVQPTQVSNHWSTGYPVLMMGGPIKSTHKGVVGGMSYATAAADVTGAAYYGSGGGLSPTDLRVAMQKAAGISPVRDGHIDIGDCHASLSTSTTPDSDLADIFFTNP